MTAAYHTPVLLHESIDGLNICEQGGTFVDVTFGGGGHSKEILQRLKAIGRGHLYALDQDADVAENILDDEQFTFIRTNFRYLKNWMRYYDVEQLDGVIADLGVSSHHFDDATRGFSFRYDAPLDMRMNRDSHHTAADILAEESEERLADIFFHYGELNMSRRIASIIVKERAIRPILTTHDLLRTVEPLFAQRREKKELAKIFQALRIEVNNEMKALSEMLHSAIDLLKTRGRLVVITYHSLEDRLVKNMLRAGTEDGKVESDFYGARHAPMRMVNKRVITPSAEEQQSNPRSRSAKMRIAEKI